MSLYLGEILISGQATLVGESRNIGQIIPSIIPLTDAGLHLLDGSLIQGNGIYSAFVDYIADLYGDGTDVPSYFTDETSWQTSVTTYGVCGKFVYDSVNNTVRLPKYSNKIYTQEFDATAPVIGNGTSIGLTNGTEYAGLGGFYAQYVGNGALKAGGFKYGAPVNSTAVNGSPELNGNIGLTTDPTKSGLVAQLSDITTSLDGYYYIVIATSTKTDIQVDIDEVVTDLNGKADVDLSNCTKPHIIETYSNGASWYRVYSDGWCEQGLTKSGDNEEWKSFLKPFADTNYNVQVTATGSSGTSAQDWAYVGAYPLYRETTRVYIRTYNQQNAIAYIYACGYIN